MRKRIAFVVNTLSDGGSEKAVSYLSCGLCGQYDIDIIVNNKDHLDYPYCGDIVSLELTAGKGVFGTLFQLRVVARRTRVLWDMKRKRKYTAVISFSDLCNVSNVLSGSRYGKTIVSVRNSISGERYASRFRQLFFPSLMSWCYRQADLTVGCSKEIMDELREERGLQKDKVRVICNGVNLPAIRKMAEEPLDSLESERMAGRKVIVCAGRLTRQKGHRYLLNVIRILKDEGLPVLLILLGEGELRTSLEAQAAQLGIGQEVILPGFRSNPYKYMANSDVVVLPSLYEGFSNVLLEALACGIPVVSTDHETGAREILAPDTDYRKKATDSIDRAKYGILVPTFEQSPDGNGRGRGSGNVREPSKEEIMAEAIKLVITDPDLAGYYRKSSLERAEQLDMERILKQWSEVIEGNYRRKK